jgi:hypothetical protein
VSVEASTARAMAASGKYWIASILVGCALISLELYLGRGGSSDNCRNASRLPSFWTLPPFHGTDCVFFNVQASEVVLIASFALCACIDWQATGSHTGNGQRLLL